MEEFFTAMAFIAIVVLGACGFLGWLPSDITAFFHSLINLIF
jgi:hypothetical protein